MRRYLHRRAFRYGIAIACACATLDSAVGGAFTRGCAARDLQVLMLIEDRESGNVVSADKLQEAMLSMLEARIVCHEGRVLDAIALYDSIVASITPDAQPTHPAK